MITLKTLPNATAQEVFDQVAKHLLAQNEKSMDSFSDQCQYRSGAWLRCAAGCLIADEEYKDRWEGVTWDDLVAQGRVPSAHYYLILSLQDIHDTVEVEDWKAELRLVAHKHNLEWRFEQ